MRRSVTGAFLLLAVVQACSGTAPGPDRGASWSAWPRVQDGGGTNLHPAPPPTVGGGDAWPVVGGGPGHTRFSRLAEIHRGNVADLEVAWTYRHGDVDDGGFLPDRVHKATAFEATPLVIDGRLIVSTPFNRVIALDPETGAELWTYDPELDTGRRFANQMVSRGVAYWSGPRGEGTCADRVLLTTLDARLIAVDAGTGVPCRDFGEGGTVDLLEGIGPMADPWEYNVTSPPTVIADRVIVGSSIADLTRRSQPSGAVRAFDIRTGRPVWRFNTIPGPGGPGHETWKDGGWRVTGGANVWSFITADPDRGVVYLPVSSPGPDFYGGDRPGPNLFGNSVVAVDARTGSHVWHFQTTHHDLWDNDVGAPPLLVRSRREGRIVDAVAVLTKTGFVYLLDRDTGRPLFPVEERPVPDEGVAGEAPHPTQPIPSAPPALVPRRLVTDDLWGPTPDVLARCRERYSRLYDRGPFTPPQTRATLLYPGNGGGANWSGGAYDPRTRTLYVPVSNSAHTIELEALPDSNVDDTGGRVLQTGWSAVKWLLTGRGTGLRYRMIRRSFSEDGEHPCHEPPWGALVAVSLDEGRILWSRPIGTDEHGHRGLPVAGPPLLTAGGLLFQAGTRDPTLEVFDARSGHRLAAFDLPAGLHGGITTYRVREDGPQYVVVAPGGHAMLGSPPGDWIIAYRLPAASSPD